MEFQKQNSALLFTGNGIYVIDNLGHNENLWFGVVALLPMGTKIETGVERQQD